MNIEQLRKSGCIILEVISGSHAYGTNKLGSDTDIRGVYVQPTEDILANNYIPQIGDEKQDIVFYEIGRFIELASKANPNILDLLVTPKDCIIYKHELWDTYFPNPEIFLTKKIEHTFSSYAYSQIQKAKGLNKKVNWEKDRVERKDILDFCYILLDNEQSIKIKSFFEIPETEFIPFKHWGLAKINNFPDCYSMYYFKDGNAGIASKDSNDVQLREIPKNFNRKHILRFDKNAYSTHCKDYREYQDWLKKRNPLRYADNAKVDNEYDCYLDSSTEYLTEFGWKKYDDITNDEILITIDNKGNKILSPILDRVKKEYTGDIYTYQNAYTKFSVTPNHNLFLSKSPRKPSQKYKVQLNTDDLKFITVDDFFKNKASTYTFFNSCVNNNNDFKIEDDYLKIMGLFLSDGSIEFNNKNIPIHAKIYQSEGGKITKIINSIGYKYKEYSYKRINKKKEYVYVFDRGLAGRLHNDCGHGSQNKSLPFWVHELSTRQLKLLVEYMFYGDGHNHSKGHRIYYTVSKKLADSLQAACLCAGITVKIMGPYKQETSYGIINTMYQVYFPNNEFNLNYLNKKRSSLKSFSGWNVQKVTNEYISCFTTISGIVITRNTNKVAIQGNTKNMMHCIRLLLTAKDVLEGKGLIIRRPEKDYLLDIREGKLSYEKILNTSETLMNEVKELVKTSKLPDEVNKKELNNLLLEIRLNNL
jgi:hypothetical protein